MKREWPRPTAGIHAVRLVSEDAGEGAPVLLLHGLAGATRWWSRNPAGLLGRFRVIGIDLPGFGASPVGARFDLDEVASQLVSTMDWFRLERASVVGHSVGGLIAAGLAAERPDRVDRLVLVDAAFLALN